MDISMALLGLGIGVAAVILLIGLIFYILYSYSHMKALKALGYDKAWLAWIPYGVNYACADAASKAEDPVELFGSFTVPAAVFKFWWIISIVLIIAPISSNITNILNLVLNGVFMGCAYAKMYAALEDKTESETQVIGCVSGCIAIVAVFKFLFMKNK